MGWPVFLADALSQAANSTIQGLGQGIQSGQQVEKNEEALNAARQEREQKSQLFPYQLRSAKAGAELAEGMGPEQIAQARYGTQLTGATLAAKIAAGNMEPQTVQAHIDALKGQAAQAFAEAERLKAEQPWIASLRYAQANHWNTVARQIEFEMNQKKVEYDNTVKAGADVANFMNNGGFNTGSVKDLINNPEFLGLLSKWGPALHTNPIVAAYLEMMRATGATEHANAMQNMFRIENEAQENGKRYIEQFYPKLQQGQEPSVDMIKGQNWLNQYGRSNTYRTFTGKGEAVGPPPADILDKLAKMYAVYGKKQVGWPASWWAADRATDAFMNRALGYIQQGYGITEAGQAAARDLASGKGTTTTPAAPAANPDPLGILR